MVRIVGLDGLLLLMRKVDFSFWARRCEHLFLLATLSHRPAQSVRCVCADSPALIVLLTLHMADVVLAQEHHFGYRVLLSIVLQSDQAIATSCN